MGFFFSVLYPIGNGNVVDLVKLPSFSSEKRNKMKQLVKEKKKASILTNQV